MLIRAESATGCEASHPCLLACLRVVLHKDGVRGGQVERPHGGLPLARGPVKETDIFHLKERTNIRILIV